MIRSVRIKDVGAEQRMFSRRAVFAALIVVLVMAALIARLIWLQIFQFDYFTELSQGNRIRIEPIPPNRGLVLDRNGAPLALNVPAYQLELIREQVPDVDATLAGLVAIGLLDPNDVERLRRAIQSRRSFEAVPVRLQLTEEELAAFAVRRQDFPGVEIRPRLSRYYPLGGTVVHAVGYVGAISEEDQARIDMASYAGTALIGKTGVESSYCTVKWASSSCWSMRRGDAWNGWGWWHPSSCGRCP
jgi:penicillin-binding protein 2